MLYNFEISNYKGFDNFKIDNLSQINIISGSNNIGKTALLEVVSIIKNSKNLRLFRTNMIVLFKSRDLDSEDINRYFENINLSIKYSDIIITIQHKFIDDLKDEEVERIERYGSDFEEFLLMYQDDNFEIIPFRREGSRFPMGIHREELQTTFINSSKPDNSRLTMLYSAIQDLGIQEKFLQYLQIIDENIIHIEPQIRDNRKSFLRISLDNPKQSVISSELGEGTNRYIEILSTLLKNSGGTVLIDEIENGIHYTKLYDIWKAIIEIVQKENIQLFVTTHDLESIEALNDASEAMNFDKVSSIKLQKDKNNMIYPVIRNHSSFVATVDSGMDIR
jgi:AAA15 family ATPase/GTPase